HVNWTNQKKGDLEGEYSLRDTQIKNLATRRGDAETRLDLAHQTVQLLEVQRPMLQEKYAELLKRNREKEGFVADLQRGPDDAVIVGPDGMALLAQTAGLQTLPEEHKLYQKKQLEIEGVLKERDGLTKEAKKLSDQLKGLRLNLAAEQEKAARA